MALFDKLSDVAKNVMDKTSDMAKSVAEKTGDMVEIGKINLKINEEKGKIEKLKNELGEYYWTMFSGGVALDEKATELCTKIKESNNNIEAYKEEIKKVETTDSQERNPVEKAEEKVEEVVNQVSHEVKEETDKMVMDTTTFDAPPIDIDLKKE